MNKKTDKKPLINDHFFRQDWVINYKEGIKWMNVTFSLEKNKGYLKIL